MKAMMFSLILAMSLHSQEKPADAPKTKTEIKAAAKDDQIALLKAQLALARAQLAIVQTEPYQELQAREQWYQRLKAAAQSNCGGEINEAEFTCTVTTKVDAAKTPVDPKAGKK